MLSNTFESTYVGQLAKLTKSVTAFLMTRPVIMLPVLISHWRLLEYVNFQRSKSSERGVCIFTRVDSQLSNLAHQKRHNFEKVPLESNWTLKSTGVNRIAEKGKNYLTPLLPEKGFWISADFFSCKNSPLSFLLGTMSVFSAKIQIYSQLL